MSNQEWRWGWNNIVNIVQRLGGRKEHIPGTEKRTRMVGSQRLKWQRGTGGAGEVDANLRY